MYNITVEEVKERLLKGEDLHLLDVREQHERDAFNIGGIHCPVGKIQTMQIDELEDWKEKEVICYCHGGVRSASAVLILETLGFKNVKNLVGGMLAWGNQS